MDGSELFERLHCRTILGWIILNTLKVCVVGVSYNTKFMTVFELVFMYG